MLKNRLHSLLHQHHQTPPGGDPFLPSQREWWDGLSLSPTEQLHVRHDLATLDHLAAQLAEVDAELRRLSCSAPWSDEVPYLMQLPGIGLLTAMTVLSAIGDVTRFPSAKKLVGYSGLGAGVYDTGQTHRGGHITKEGRRELRSVLVEAAWRTVDSSDFWRAEFERLCRRMHQNKAVVAIARKLLVVIWHVWTAHAADRQANPDLVAFKLMTWSWKLNDEQRGGLTTRQFVRYGSTAPHVSLDASGVRA
jgi:transposase